MMSLSGVIPARLMEANIEVKNLEHLVLPAPTLSFMGTLCLRHKGEWLAPTIMICLI